MGWNAPGFKPPRAEGGQQEDCPWLVSAVILNWNASNHTCECLESLTRQTYPGDKLEVVVIDNGSVEDTMPIQKALEQYQKSSGWKRARIIRLPYNMGIPAGYNVGLRNASPDGDALLRLDNDVVLDSRFIELAVSAMTQMPALAALGGSQWKEDRKAVGLPCTIRWWKLGIQFFSPDSTMGPIDCDTLPGCALLIRREAIRGMEVVFDPGLLVLHDETDLLIRLKKAGWRIGYLAVAQCIHKGGASTKRIPKFFRYITARNITLLARRYAPFPARIGSYLSIVRSLLQSMIEQDRLFTRGFMDGLLGDPWNPRATRALPRKPEG